MTRKRYIFHILLGVAVASLPFTRSTTSWSSNTTTTTTTTTTITTTTIIATTTTRTTTSTSDNATITTQILSSDVLETITPNISESAEVNDTISTFEIYNSSANITTTTTTATTINAGLWGVGNRFGITESDIENTGDAETEADGGTTAEFGNLELNNTEEFDSSEFTMDKVISADQQMIQLKAYKTQLKELLERVETDILILEKSPRAILIPTRLFTIDKSPSNLNLIPESISVEDSNSTISQEFYSLILTGIPISAIDNNENNFRNIGIGETTDTEYSSIESNNPELFTSSEQESVTGGKEDEFDYSENFRKSLVIVAPNIDEKFEPHRFVVDSRSGYPKTRSESSFEKDTTPEISYEVDSSFVQSRIQTKSNATSSPISSSYGKLRLSSSPKSDSENDNSESNPLNSFIQSQSELKTTQENSGFNRALNTLKKLNRTFGEIEFPTTTSQTTSIPTSNVNPIESSGNRTNKNLTPNFRFEVNSTNNKLTEKMTHNPSESKSTTPTPFVTLDKPESISVNDLEKESIIVNNTSGCLQWSKADLIQMLKDKATYNPDFMAWDVVGVRRFLDKTTMDSYDEDPASKDISPMTQEKNLESIEKMISELDLKNCEISNPEMKSKLYNITHGLRSYYQSQLGGKDNLIPPSTTSSPSPTTKKYLPPSHYEFFRRSRFSRNHIDRSKRSDSITSTEEQEFLTENVVDQIYQKFFDHRHFESARKFSADESRTRDPDSSRNPGGNQEQNQSANEDDSTDKDSMNQPSTSGVGIVHLYECEKRGTHSAGYMRMCGACRAIRVMPSRFFPPFINEVVCDEDKACLYFYDYPHGKCKQKFLNFVVLENVGTEDCQIWKRYTLNVRVCCECFVDQMSFFSKYV